MSHRWLEFVAAMLAGVLACAAAHAGEEKLLEVRDDHETELVRTVRDAEPLETPPEELFQLVEYQTDLGPMSAYLGKSPGPGKHPAIVWLTGGFPVGGIGSTAWEPVSSDNDQSARAYREVGVVMMYPALRGAHGNPGVQESFYGEVDDVLAALEHLRQVDYVDPEQIYLGGHSTGGTLVLLVAAATDELAGAIAFGPIDDPANYGESELTYDPDDAIERLLRAPIEYLDAIGIPMLVIEGAIKGNGESLHAMQEATENPNVRFLLVEGANHFDVLAPANDLLARKIARDRSTDLLQTTANDIASAQRELLDGAREEEDRQTLAALQESGVDLSRRHEVQHFLMSREKPSLAEVGAPRGWTAADIEEMSAGGETFYIRLLVKRMRLNSPRAVHAASKEIAALAVERGVEYGGWRVR